MSQTKSSGFFAKIKDNYSNKFSGLSLNANTEKDGSIEDDTLIHNAFVKYFTNKGEGYPDWLGVKEQAKSQPQRQYQSQYQPQNYQNYQNQNYNNQGNQQQNFQPQGRSQYQPQPTYQPQNSQPQSQNSYQNPPQSAPQQQTYQPRSNSRLQDMYNKSRQQAVPASGYNSQPAAPGRSNSYSTGSRLRERMLNNSPSMTQISSHSNSPTPPPLNSKATWGRK